MIGQRGLSSKFLSYWIVFHEVLSLLMCNFQIALWVISNSLLVVVFVDFILHSLLSFDRWCCRCFGIGKIYISPAPGLGVLLLDLGYSNAYKLLLWQILELRYVSLKNEFVGFVLVCREKFRFLIILKKYLLYHFLCWSADSKNMVQFLLALCWSANRNFG